MTLASGWVPTEGAGCLGQDRYRGAGGTAEVQRPSAGNGPPGTGSFPASRVTLTGATFWGETPRLRAPQRGMAAALHAKDEIRQDDRIEATVGFAQFWPFCATSLARRAADGGVRIIGAFTNSPKARSSSRVVARLPVFREISGAVSLPDPQASGPPHGGFFVPVSAPGPWNERPAAPSLISTEADRAQEGSSNPATVHVSSSALVIRIKCFTRSAVARRSAVVNDRSLREDR